jgi:hypothetical protein
LIELATSFPNNQVSTYIWIFDRPCI